MTTLRARPDVTSADRLGLTLFLAATIHALIILGISFSTLGNKPADKLINTLDITLVQTHTRNAPDNPDYLAQANQEGGGTTRERIPTRSPDTPLEQQQTQGNASQSRPRTSPTSQQREQTPLLTARASSRSINSANKSIDATQPEPVNMAQIMQSRHAIIRQSSEDQPEWQAYGAQPDPQNLYARTKKHAESAYISAWTSKVKKIGNLNYPEEARRRQLSGNLMLRVVLNPDGSLKQVVLLKSSGHKVLDDAAKRIVRLASPFEKVPANILNKRPVFSFERTWAFTSSNQMISR